MRRSFLLKLLACLALVLVEAGCIAVEELRSLGENSGVVPVSAVDTPGYLVCWNVHKASDERFKEEVQELLNEIPKQNGVILCMQEVRSSTWQLIKDLHREKVNGHYASSWRFPFSGRSTGVLTISNRPLPISGASALRSRQREFVVASPKVSLHTEMPFAGNRKLDVVNCHGLNFVSQSAFSRQLDQVFECLNGSDSPAIVCGDFNVWSEERLKILQQKAGLAGLSEVRLEGPEDSPAPQWLRGLKRVNGYDPNIRLDRVFTRGVEVLGFRSGKASLSSDHLPLLLRFQLAAGP